MIRSKYAFGYEEMNDKDGKIYKNIGITHYEYPNDTYDVEFLIIKFKEYLMACGFTNGAVEQIQVLYENEYIATK